MMNTLRSRILVVRIGHRFAAPIVNSCNADSATTGARHSVMQHCYAPHTISRFASSTVRRRRGSDGVSFSPPAEAGDDNVERKRAAPHMAVTDPEVFRTEADKLLEKIEKALRPMEKYNEVFKITLMPRDQYKSGSLTLELKPDDGMYKLEVNDGELRVVFQSAISGSYKYALSASTGEWVDEKDGHSFEGMLVRDLIRQCNGLPDL